MKINKRNLLKLLVIMIAVLLLAACSKNKKPATADDDPNATYSPATQATEKADPLEPDATDTDPSESEAVDPDPEVNDTDPLTTKPNLEATIPDPVVTEPEEQETAVQAFWNGDWYGYFLITEFNGVWQSYVDEDEDENYFYDAIMTIDMDKESYGDLSIVLVGDEKNIVETTVRGDETHLELVEGNFLNAALDEGDWWIGWVSPEGEGYLVVIYDNYHDLALTDKDGFEYMFFFRPWGELWEMEEREGERVPPGYEQYKAGLGR